LVLVVGVTELPAVDKRSKLYEGFKFDRYSRTLTTSPRRLPSQNKKDRGNMNQIHTAAVAAAAIVTVFHAPPARAQGNAWIASWATAIQGTYALPTTPQGTAVPE
jgi:hypothetical protein